MRVCSGGRCTKRTRGRVGGPNYTGARQKLARIRPTIPALDQISVDSSQSLHNVGQDLSNSGQRQLSSDDVCPTAGPGWPIFGANRADFDPNSPRVSSTCWPGLGQTCLGSSNVEAHLTGFAPDLDQLGQHRANFGLTRPQLRRLRASVAEFGPKSVFALLFLCMDEDPRGNLAKTEVAIVRPAQHVSGLRAGTMRARAVLGADSARGSLAQPLAWVRWLRARHAGLPPPAGQWPSGDRRRQLR